MISCAYCDQPATLRIVPDPQQVCLEHALEYWTGLLAYTRDRSDVCVKDEGLCGCLACEEQSALYLRTEAIAAADASPGDHEPFTIRLAS